VRRCDFVLIDVFIIVVITNTSRITIVFITTTTSIIIVFIITTTNIIMSSSSLLPSPALSFSSSLPPPLHYHCLFDSVGGIFVSSHRLLISDVWHPCI